MHTWDITYADKYDRDHEQPETYTVNHNGDWSGSVRISMKGHHIVDADIGNVPDRNAIIDVEIPFDVLGAIIGQAVIDKKISDLEQVDDYKAFLGLS